MGVVSSPPNNLKDTTIDQQNERKLAYLAKGNLVEWNPPVGNKTLSLNVSDLRRISATL
jgi:hypothetical protein